MKTDDMLCSFQYQCLKMMTSTNHHEFPRKLMGGCFNSLIVLALRESSSVRRTCLDFTSMAVTILKTVTVVITVISMYTHNNIIAPTVAVQ